MGGRACGLRSGPHCYDRKGCGRLEPHCIPVKAKLPSINQPPFAAAGELGPAPVALMIVAQFKSFLTRADRLEHGYTMAMRSLAVPTIEPLQQAGLGIARDIDGGVGAGVVAGYHNAQHFLEVMLSALYLARLGALEAGRAARVVTAGLVHDFHHDGSRGTTAPFRLEKLAVQEALPYLRQAGVPAAERARLETLILATEPRSGVPFARACWMHHCGSAALPKFSAALPAPLERLLSDADLAQEAELLAEADVLPSVGLTVQHAEQLQARLAAEWGTTLGRADKLQFVERMVGDISAAAFFVPNMLGLRDAYRHAG